MGFFLDHDEDIEYRVYRYRAIEGLRKQDPKEHRGKATSLTVSYSTRQEQIHLVFGVPPYGGNIRYGRLSLHFTPANMPKGEWASHRVIEEGVDEMKYVEPSAGSMMTVRPQSSFTWWDSEYEGRLDDAS